MGAGSIRNERSFRLIWKRILDGMFDVDVENEQFWTDLETFYLPSGNIDLATADEWRTAYIMVCCIPYALHGQKRKQFFQLGLDTGYAQFAYEFADAGRETGAPFWKLNFRFDINQALEEPCCRVEGDWREPWHGDDLMFYFGYVIGSGKGTDQEIELSKKMMKLIGEFGNTGKPDMTVVGESFDWTEFNPDADALIIDKTGEFKMEPLWRTDAMVFWKNHLLVAYPKP